MRWRWLRTVWLYIAREVVLYTLLGLAAITVVMVTRSLVRVLDELIGAGFHLEDFLTVVRLLGTMLFVYALPVSFLFGVLLAIGRMAADVEITAMRACGIGVAGILLPVAVLGTGFSALTLELTLDVEPGARRDMTTAVRRMLVRGATVAAGQFNTVGDRTLYVDEREGANRLRGIVISDRTDPERPFVIFAEEGEMRLDADAGELSLLLERGDLHVEPDSVVDARYQRVSFERFEYTIDMGRMLGPRAYPRAKEMSLEELRDTVERIEAGEPDLLLRDEPRVYATNLQRRYATPVAPMLFALVGVPLGMRRTRGARSFGVLLCAALAFVYYGLQSFCEFLSTDGVLEPWIALWIPNAAFAALGVALLVRARRAT